MCVVVDYVYLTETYLHEYSEVNETGGEEVQVVNNSHKIIRR